MAVEHGKIHVNPDPGLADTIRSSVGWKTDDEDTSLLTANSIDEKTEDEVRLDE